jgi:hypothetical protein
MMSCPIVELEQYESSLHELLTHPTHYQSEGHDEDDDDDAQEHI